MNDTKTSSKQSSLPSGLVRGVGVFMASYMLTEVVSKDDIENANAEYNGLLTYHDSSLVSNQALEAKRGRLEDFEVDVQNIYRRDGYDSPNDLKQEVTSELETLKSEYASDAETLSHSRKSLDDAIFRIDNASPTNTAYVSIKTQEEIHDAHLKDYEAFTTMQRQDTKSEGLVQTTEASVLAAGLLTLFYVGKGLNYLRTKNVFQ